MQSQVQQQLDFSNGPRDSSAAGHNNLGVIRIGSIAVQSDVLFLDGTS